MTNEVNELIRTPAAARSFIFFIVSFLRGEIKSVMFSIAELNISDTNTNPVANITATHSIADNLNIIEAIMTNNAARRWILELCSSLIRILSPLNAGIKLLILFNTENFSSFISV